MADAGVKSIYCHGVWAFNSRHEKIRKIRRKYPPSSFGDRVWPTSWLLVDYFLNRGLPRDLRVLDLCCGWGLAGIFCAKTFDSSVVGLDMDAAVFPYLLFLAEENEVELEIDNTSFQDLTLSKMSEFDVVIGSDLCFWERLVDPLKDLVGRAVGAGVKLIVLADPGRPTFNELGDYCEEQGWGSQFYWRTSRPYNLQGQIIEIGSAPGE